MRSPPPQKKKNPPAPWLFPRQNVFPSRQRTVPAFLRSLSRELKKKPVEKRTDESIPCGTRGVRGMKSTFPELLFRAAC